MASQESPSEETPTILKSPSEETLSKLNLEELNKAIKSLLKWKHSNSEPENPLQDDEFLYLILNLKGRKRGRTSPYKIPLPHPLYPAESSQLCLIIDDREKSTLTKADAQKKVSSENIGVSKLLWLSKLKSDYRSFDAKKKLCDSYDMFLADNRIIPMLPQMLGKCVYKKKKNPVPVDLRHKNWKEQIEKACESALLYLRSGKCCTLKVAKGSMAEEEIVSNVVAAVDGAVEVVPAKWANVRCFCLKFAKSAEMVIYGELPVVKIGGTGTKKNKKKDGNVKKDAKVDMVSKKGRISEVRDIDTKVDILLDANEFESDDDVNLSKNEISEDDDLDIKKLENKKPKKGDSKKRKILSKKSGKKGSKKLKVGIEEADGKIKKMKKK